MFLTLRPTKGQKLRFEYIPIDYTQSATLKANIVFNGQKYQLGVPVNSELQWKAYRFAYEYDFVVKNRGFAGFIVEAKYTDVNVQLSAPGPLLEFAHAQAPIPAIGGIGRFYVVPNISITAEVTGFKLPDTIDKRYAAHYVDADIYGTVNVTNYLGAQVGWRSLDVGYLVKTDTGSLTLQGLYFGAVLRMTQRPRSRSWSSFFLLRGRRAASSSWRPAWQLRLRFVGGIRSRVRRRHNRR